MSWTDDRIELLTRLWGSGLSASQIAAQLGGVSRNAVIGKVHRLKLDGRVRAANDAEATVEDAAAPVEVAEAAITAEQPGVEARIIQMQPAQRTLARGGAVDGATALKFEAVDAEAVAEFEAPAARPSAEVVPMTRNLTLVQLTERTCKWPLGDPLSPDFRFCGNAADEGAPYCQHHARIAFQPSTERRRAR